MVQRILTPLVLCAQLVACGRPLPHVTVPPALPASLPRESPAAAHTTSPVDTTVLVLQSPGAEADATGPSLDELNRDSPFPLVFFDYDSAELDVGGRTIVQAAAEVLRTHGSWIVAIEAHCDERGTAAYNVALGERRAEAVEVYLIALGVPARQLRIASYGEEFPLDPAHSEAAWTKNRRVQLVVISK